LAWVFLWWALLRAKANREAAAKFFQGTALVLNGAPKPPNQIPNTREVKEPMGFQPKSRDKAREY
jgi:hypothetical protein